MRCPCKAFPKNGVTYKTGFNACNVIQPQMQCLRELICHMQSLCVANFVTLTWFQLKLKQMFASMKMRPPYFFIYDHLH